MTLSGVLPRNNPLPHPAVPKEIRPNDSWHRIRIAPQGRAVSHRNLFEKEQSMPIIKSAKKRMKQDQERRRRNRAAERQVRTATRKFSQLLNEKKDDEAKKMLPEVVSLVDKVSAKGVWHKNKAAREKSKLMKKVSK